MILHQVRIMMPEQHDNIKDKADPKPTKDSKSEADEQLDDIKTGGYVITSSSVGQVIGQSASGGWVVEWPYGDKGETEFGVHPESDLVTIDIKEEE